MMAAADPILVVENIVKRFETQDGVLVAVDDVSFTVAPGEFLSVIGPSGCGKSTLFNVIGGLMDGYTGRVAVGGETIRGPHPSIGMIFQEESTFPWRTVIDNVAFPLEIAGVAKAERLDKARHFVELVGLTGFERRYPAELSGGMRQRVSMARTLASEPKILLMDEPFAALDEITRFRLNNDLMAVAAALRMTVVFVTHSVFESVFLSNRVVVMTPRPGRLFAELPIDTPFPRDERFRTSPEYAAQCRRVSDTLSQAMEAKP